AARSDLDDDPPRPAEGSRRAPCRLPPDGPAPRASPCSVLVLKLEFVARDPHDVAVLDAFPAQRVVEADVAEHFLQKPDGLVICQIQPRKQAAQPFALYHEHVALAANGVVF